MKWHTLDKKEKTELIPKTKETKHKKIEKQIQPAIKGGLFYVILYLKFKKEERRCVIWNEKYLIPYIEKENENYYFLNYKKAEKEG